MRDTSGRGDRTELEVALALVRQGRRVLRPMWSASRYDLLLDNDNGTFTRIQCKSGVLRDGAVVFRVCSVSGHRSVGTPYHGQVDAFGVYCPATGSTYLVPTASIAPHSSNVRLRIAPARNGQRRRVNSAEEFVIPRASDART